MNSAVFTSSSEEMISSVDKLIKTDIVLSILTSSLGFILL